MHSTLRPFGLAGLLTLLLAGFTTAPAFAQWTPDRLAADESELPRTPWGAPDLQGMWNNSTTTPLERLTSEEQALGRQAQQAVIEATRGTGAGWLEQAGQIERESLIIDPPDGRIRMAEQACSASSSARTRGPAAARPIRGATATTGNGASRAPC